MTGRIDLTKSMVNISMRMKSKRTWGILGKENNGITMQMEKDFENARQSQVGCPFQRSVSVEVSCLRSGRFQSLSFAVLDEAATRRKKIKNSV